MKRYATLVVNILITTTIFSGAVLASNFVSADDVVDEINITVPVSCSMSGIGMTSHNAEIVNGTYTADIGTTTLHAFCNDSEGFAIYAAGYTGDVIGETDSNKLVGASTSTAIETGLATTAENPDISNWAMKLAITQDSGDTIGTNVFTIDSAPNEALPSQADQSATSASFSSYHVVPNEYVKVAHKNSATDMTTTTGGVKLTTTYAAYISKTQSADTYSGQVIYTLVHPASAAAPRVPVSCNPSGTTIGTNSSTDIVCMQDFASLSSSDKSTLINSMTLEQTYTLTDMRDEKTYTLAKLKDGNVWMTQNLDLDLDKNITYTNEDTDLGWNGTSYSVASWAPLRSTYSSTTKAWCQGGVWDSLNKSCQNNYTPESFDPGDLYWNGTLNNGNDWDAYRNSCTWDGATYEPTCDETLNPIDTYTTVSGTPTPEYHLGNYYNWNAAVAVNNSSTYTVYEQDINQSICPAGWTLVKNWYSNGSFRVLLGYYGWDDSDYSINPDIWNSAIKLPPSGSWMGLFDSIGNIGFLWSSMVVDSYRSVAVFATRGSVFPDYESLGSRADGFSVRCFVRQ